MSHTPWHSSWQIVLCMSWIINGKRSMANRNVGQKVPCEDISHFTLVDTKQKVAVLNVLRNKLLASDSFIDHKLWIRYWRNNSICGFSLTFISVSVAVSTNHMQHTWFYIYPVSTRKHKDCETNFSILVSPFVVWWFIFPLWSVPSHYFLNRQSCSLGLHKVQYVLAFMAAKNWNIVETTRLSWILTYKTNSLPSSKCPVVLLAQKGSTNLKSSSHI